MIADRWQYLVVLAACVVITAPLEFLGAGVYRHGRRAIRSILPVAIVFVVWDLIAIVGHVWTYDPRYVSGFDFGALPLEELLFFVVVPVCGLLTYTAVQGVLHHLARFRRSRVRTS